LNERIKGFINNSSYTVIIKVLRERQVWRD
jgi:hypothetical protein